MAHKVPLQTLDLSGFSLRDGLMLAPMSGLTDLPFRACVRRFGAGVQVSEMVASEAVLHALKDTDKLRGALDKEPSTIIQLAGTHPDLMAEAARLLEAGGAAMIDLNFGCPARKVVGKASGSALMRDPRLAREIFVKVRDAVQLPLSVKMRLGWDSKALNSLEIASLAQEAGFSLVTLHARTRNQFFEGRADWRLARETAESLRIPLFINGDIRDSDSAREALAQSGAKGLMVGRASEGKPWVLARIKAELAGENYRLPSREARGEILLELLEGMIAHYGLNHGLRRARKHLVCFGHGLDGNLSYRAEVGRMTDLHQVRARVAVHFGLPALPQYFQVAA